MAATNNTTTATPPAPAPATTARPAGAAGAVWDAVTATPGATIPAIATAAGVTRAVAKTELTALVAAGQVTRTAGERGDNGRALPDTWNPVTAAPAIDTTPATATDEATDEDTVPEVPAVTAQTIADAMAIMQEEADRRAKAEAELAKAVAEEEARRSKIMLELAQARTAEDTRRALADLLAAVTTTYAAVVSGDEAATAAGLERIFAGTDTVRVATGATPARATRPRTGTGGGVARSGDRAAPRPLRPEVIAHLAAHPGKDFTPGEIAKVLDRSSGAVANALDTLAKKGEATLTSEHPARYTTAAPTTAAATSDTPAATTTEAPATQAPATDATPATTADGQDAPEAA